ncbi:MAG: maleylpyruvate isomerase family mycothiol-dependent enzyme [Candidatus Dormibacteria bacterium]
MNAVAIAVRDIPALEHTEAMRLAEAEYERLLDLVDNLSASDWTRPTDCPGWDVRAMLGHLLGMFELLSDRTEAARQFGTAAQACAEKGGERIDALTAMQVEEHAQLTASELATALHERYPTALAGRRDTSEEERAAPFDTGNRVEGVWTRGYLLDVILTRDPWLHRIDICRATGRDPVLTADHDGRIIANVVADWAARHGQDCTLILDGPAGGTYTTGAAEPEIRVDAVEFCRILSGRGTGEGLLRTRIAF